MSSRVDWSGAGAQLSGMSCAVCRAECVRVHRRSSLSLTGTGLALQQGKLISSRRCILLYTAADLIFISVPYCQDVTASFTVTIKIPLRKLEMLHYCSFTTLQDGIILLMFWFAGAM